MDMEPNPIKSLPPERLEDEELARRIVAGDKALFELLMRRHNQRVYRAVRSLLRDESEAEDVMQQAWVQAWAHLPEFRGESRFATWLVRIAINEALARLRRTRKLVPLPGGDGPEESHMPPSPRPSPEQLAADRELVAVVQRKLDALPDIYRTVVMLREVEGMSTEETAQALGTSIDVVKTRLHRARTMLHEALAEDVEAHFGEAFPFLGPRCDRMVAAVLARIADL